MEKITTFQFDPVKTPGIIHAENLTKESALEVLNFPRHGRQSHSEVVKFQLQALNREA